MEDPNLHLSISLRFVHFEYFNGSSTDTIRPHLFSFSLKDKVRAWLYSLPSGSIITWEELTEAFIAKFFPPNMMMSLTNLITSFAQRDNESLYKVWELFKDLLRLYPFIVFKSG